MDRTSEHRWADGTVWILRMDQGLGYWWLQDGNRLPFPFQYSTDRQIEFLEQISIANVIANHHRHPTYWYLGG